MFAKMKYEQNYKPFNAYIPLHVMIYLNPARGHGHLMLAMPYLRPVRGGGHVLDGLICFTF